MRDLYPDYDVLSKTHTPSWNEQTREVIRRRLAIASDKPQFFTHDEWHTLKALCDRIVPQPDRADPVPVAALVDEKMASDRRDGYRLASLPSMQKAWRHGLAALDDEARTCCGFAFESLTQDKQDEMLQAISEGTVKSAAWQELDPKAFFKHRVLDDVVSAYYSHPTAWSEIGWGGPAAPRGYVRMDFNQRDGWEAAEAKPGQEDEARRENRRVGR